MKVAHDLDVRMVPTSVLVPDPRNARKHSKRNVDAIASSLSRFGQRRPLIVRADMTVIAGNGTLEAARALGWDKVAVTTVPQGWSDEQARAYAIADNRTAELASWDEVALLETLTQLDAAGWEMTDLGFAPLAEELSRIREDEMPALPETPLTSPGDVITLGQHRLMCGDATSEADVATLMGGELADVVFTDPPWNVAIGLDSNPRHRRRAGLRNDDLPQDEFDRFLTAAAARMREIASGDIYCVLGASGWPTLDAALRGAGFHWSSTLIWVKDTFVLGRSKYHRRYEPVWYGWGEGASSSFRGRRDLDDVWEIPRPRRSEEHPTMKPVALPARAIANSCPTGGVVADLFAGAGSTLLAAEQMDRRCLAMEIEPAYCDVIVSRWEAATGKAALR